MKLAQVLFSQGMGARRECEGLIASGHVTLAGQVCDDPFAEVNPEGLVFGVRGELWPYHAKALIVLNKPAGYECSQKPKHHPSVYSLLPGPLRRRDVQAVGRLDEDTTGLLLLTDSASRAVAGEYNGERIVGRAWPAADNHLALLELHH